MFEFWISKPHKKHACQIPSFLFLVVVMVLLVVAGNWIAEGMERGGEEIQSIF